MSKIFSVLPIIEYCIDIVFDAWPLQVCTAYHTITIINRRERHNSCFCTKVRTFPVVSNTFQGSLLVPFCWPSPLNTCSSSFLDWPPLFGASCWWLPLACCCWHPCLGACLPLYPVSLPVLICHYHTMFFPHAFTARTCELYAIIPKDGIILM
jgi:hypothetical protein